MPLYDCLLLAKPLVNREAMADLVGRVARRAYQRNGVVTDLQWFGTVKLVDGIKKLDGRHFKGQLMQMTMMVPPTFTQELHYLNKEDRLLRWLVVKHRDAVYGLFDNEDDFLKRDGKRGTDGMGLRTVGAREGSDDDSEDDAEYEHGMHAQSSLHF